MRVWKKNRKKVNKGKTESLCYLHRGSAGSSASRSVTTPVFDFFTLLRPLISLRAAPRLEVPNQQLGCSLQTAFGVMGNEQGPRRVFPGLRKSTERVGGHGTGGKQKRVLLSTVACGEVVSIVSPALQRHGEQLVLVRAATASVAERRAECDRVRVHFAGAADVAQHLLRRGTVRVEDNSGVLALRRVAAKKRPSVLLR
eukprot:Hpha_TRINITY_DN24807_c0_g1::TRINITY_DN24807_c0_g1_i1::g.97247::m.97247